MSGWVERKPAVTLGFIAAPTIKPRRRRFGLELLGAFLAGFAVAMLLVALVR